MRKWIAWGWMLALYIGLSLGAMAEDIEFDYDLVMFDNSSAYAYAVPKGWVPIEATEEEKAAGQIGKWQSPDQSITMIVSLEGYERTEDLVDPLSLLIADPVRYPDIEMDDLLPYFAHMAFPQEGIQSWITVTLDDEGNSYYARFDFDFAPENDETVQKARTILSLLRENMDEEEEIGD